MAGFYDPFTTLGSFNSPVAKPLLSHHSLGALADSGASSSKNGSYRMVLKGVDEIDWFTDSPDRVAGGGRRRAGEEVGWSVWC